jgi:hypothetical protein
VAWNEREDEKTRAKRSFDVNRERPRFRDFIIDKDLRPGVLDNAEEFFARRGRLSGKRPSPRLRLLRVGEAWDGKTVICRGLLDWPRLFILRKDYRRQMLRMLAEGFWEPEEEKKCASPNVQNAAQQSSHSIYAPQVLQTPRRD